MKNKMGEKVVLFLAGIIAVGIGLAAGLWPKAFYASSGIFLGENISLLSEVRAPAMVLTVSGLIMLAAVMASKFRAFALAVAAVLYLSYGGGRLLSLAMDGVPHFNLLAAMVLEIGVGLLCVYTFWRQGDPT